MAEGVESPSFTLDTYVHLLDEALPDPPLVSEVRGRLRAACGRREPVCLENELLAADATPTARGGQARALSSGDEVPE
jgi:hypothetical protein